MSQNIVPLKGWDKEVKCIATFLAGCLHAYKKVNNQKKSSPTPISMLFCLSKFVQMLTISQFSVVDLCHLLIQFAQAKLNLNQVDEGQVSPGCQ